MRDPRLPVVIGACSVQFMVIGFLFAFSVFFAEIEAEFGWSRTLISLGYSIAMFMMGTLAIPSGQLNDRFGPTRVLTFSGVLFALGIALMSQMNAPWQYLALYGTLIAVGFATHDVVTLSTVARWYDKRRGLMTGIVKTGTAAGQVVMPLLAAALIVWFGWRSGMLVLAGIALSVLIVAAYMIRLPRDEEAPQTLQGAATGLSYAEARRTRAFWTICAIQFLFFPALMTVPLHIAVHAQDLGLSQSIAALMLSVMGAASVLGRLALGSATDRLGGRNAYLLALGLLLTSLVLLPWMTVRWPLTGVVALYGVAHGALFVVVSPTVARLFGMRSHGAIFGTVLFCGTTGGALGPTLAGWVFDSWGSYTPAFAVLAAGAGLAIVLAMTLPSAVFSSSSEPQPGRRSAT